MSNDLNNCAFIGRLGKDVEARYSASGEAIASFSIAVGSQWKNKQGEKQDSTEWVNITAFGKLGEICAEYLKKGSQVYISGRMKTDKYDDKNGVTKYSTKIIADRMQMLGGRPTSSDEPIHQEQERPQRATSDFSDLGDDIPF